MDLEKSKNGFEKDKKNWSGIVTEFQNFMPLDDDEHAVSLQEGNTPLIDAPELADRLGISPRLYLKYDGANPTGSFKDRGMAMAVSKAAASESEAVICASTGNTSAAAAAYAARAGLKAIVVVPEGNIARGKMAQALIHGAEVVPIEDNFDRALEIVVEISENSSVELVNSLNPYRIEGQKSGAFEICQQLGEAPDVLAIPVGNAGNITAYWKGFKEYFEAGRIDDCPGMFGFEARGAAAITEGRVIKNPETVASAIRIGDPASREKAVKASRESGGLITSVSDSRIIEAYKLIARFAGVFAEPASAASVAGLKKLAENDELPDCEKITAVLTGHGLKDPDVVENEISIPGAVSPDLDSVCSRAKISLN